MSKHLADVFIIFDFLILPIINFHNINKDIK